MFDHIKTWSDYISELKNASRICSILTEPKQNIIQNSKMRRDYVLPYQRLVRVYLRVQKCVQDMFNDNTVAPKSTARRYFGRLPI